MHESFSPSPEKTQKRNKYSFDRSHKKSSSSRKEVPNVITTIPPFLTRPSVPFLENLSPIDRAKMRRVNRRERRVRRTQRITLYRNPMHARADLL